MMYGKEREYNFKVMHLYAINNYVLKLMLDAFKMASVLNLNLTMFTAPLYSSRHVRIQIFPNKKTCMQLNNYYYNVSMVITPHYSELQTPNLHQILQES